MSQARDFADSFSAVSTGRRNLVINGAMQVHQRNADRTDSGYGLDRFRFYESGGTTTFTQGSVASGTDPYSKGFRDTFKMTNTTSGSNTATDYAGVHYRFEGQDIVRSGWEQNSTSSYMTLSLWVKSSLAGTYPIFVRSLDGTQQSFLKEITLVADTWKKVVFSFPGDADITVDDDTGHGFDIVMWAYLGTDFTGTKTADAWSSYSGSIQTNDFAQNWKQTANATYEITGVQLELGNSASPFEHRSYGEELALCQRYYYEIGDNQGQRYLGGIVHRSATTSYGMGQSHPTFMRASPTVTWDDITVYRGDSSGVVSSASFDCTTWGWAMNATYASTGGTDGDAAMIYSNNGGYIKFDAEI